MKYAPIGTAASAESNIAGPTKFPINECSPAPKLWLQQRTLNGRSAMFQDYVNNCLKKPTGQRSIYDLF